jgi:hypothetical protein
MMMRRAGILTAALSLLLVGGAVAQQVFSGTVLRTDPAAGVIVFDDGRMVQTTADSVIVSGNRRAALDTLQPGASVTVYSGQPVALSNGRYVPGTPPAPGVAAAPAPGVGAPPPPPRAVVTAPPAVAPPATTIVTTPVAGISTIRGVVARVDEANQVIDLTDGRRVHVNSDTDVRLENGHGVTRIGALQRGTPVTVSSTRPFVAVGDTVVAASPVASGSVVRVDPSGAIVLSDGRVVPITADTVAMVDNRPVAMTAVAPGSQVVIYQAPGLAAASPRFRE